MSLMLLLAKEMPEDMLIDQLSEALEKYKLAPSEDTKKMLGMTSMLIATRFATEGKDTLDLMKKQDEIHKVAERLNITG